MYLCLFLAILTIARFNPCLDFFIQFRNLRFLFAMIRSLQRFQTRVSSVSFVILASLPADLHPVTHATTSCSTIGHTARPFPVFRSDKLRYVSRPPISDFVESSVSPRSHAIPTFTTIIFTPGPSSFAKIPVPKRSQRGPTRKRSRRPP